MHYSMMRTASLPIVHALVDTRCQYQSGGPEVNKFKQVSSDGHHVLLSGDPMSDDWGSGAGHKVPCLIFRKARWACTGRSNASWV